MTDGTILEAEDSELLVAPMEVRADTVSSGGQYVGSATPHDGFAFYEIASHGMALQVRLRTRTTGEPGMVGVAIDGSSRARLRVSEDQWHDVAAGALEAITGNHLLAIEAQDSQVEVDFIAFDAIASAPDIDQPTYPFMPSPTTTSTATTPTPRKPAVPGAPEAVPETRPRRLEPAFAEILVDGNADVWSASRNRNLATQSRLPHLNGGFGTEEAECGLGGRVIKVTNLADSGAGSLRAALEATGPRTVVFEVSGSIKLRSRIRIHNPYLTIAGHTAPPPGIAVYHEKLSIATHDVCVQHIRVRLGDRHADGNFRTDLDVADALSVYNQDAANYNIVIDNVSLSWGLDEILDIGSRDVTDVTVRDSLISEPLLGTEGHAYCLLLSDYGANERRVSFIGNVLAHCYRRNPRVGEGSNVVVNHFIYNPGRHAIHLSGNANSLDLWTTLVGNTMAFPTSPENLYDGYRSAFALIENIYLHEPRTARVYLFGNVAPAPYAVYREFHRAVPAVIAEQAEVWDRTIFAMFAEDIEPILLGNAGAFPRHRDPVDARVIADIRNRRGTYLDSQFDVEGYIELEQHTRPLAPPREPQGDDDGDGINDLEEWLQGFVEAVE